MLSESDLFYYVALAIVCFIVLYIIYITMNFQNNVMESFSLGGGNKDNEKKTKEEKTLDDIENQITVLEDGLKLKDNKDIYSDILNGMKRSTNLTFLSMLVKDSKMMNDKDYLSFITQYNQILNMTIEFVDKE